MSVHEELEEQVHHAHEPFDRKVAVTTAIVAAGLAVVSVLGQVLTTEELLHQEKASDQWAYSQAKDIRHYTAKAVRDILRASAGKAELAAQYDADEKRYKDDTASIQEKARELERESERAGHKASRLHLGEVFFEVAIVLSSLAILSKKQSLWLIGVLSALVGASIASTAFLF
jgi:hypothetical protein